MKNWYCENENCRAYIGDERYQCAGCFLWFCRSCSRACNDSKLRVCRSCWTIWTHVSRAFQGGCVYCGKRRQKRNALLCDACEQSLGGQAF